MELLFRRYKVLVAKLLETEVPSVSPSIHHCLKSLRRLILTFEMKYYEALETGFSDLYQLY